MLYLAIDICLEISSSIIIIIIIIIIILPALQSMTKFDLLYDCLPLVLILWLSSPISIAHCLQIFFSWIQPRDIKSAYSSSTLWIM
jgi:hypothetical protein